MSTSSMAAAAGKRRPLNIYRKLLCGVTLLGLAAGAAAQAAPSTPAKKKQRSARAVGLLEWKKDAKGVLAPRLVPVSFLWEGKYYDAGLYEASPRPMALEPGTVYEATRSGVPAGLFTVRGGVFVKDVWYGDGIWSPGVSGLVKGAAGDDERPRLSRAAELPADTAAPPAAETPASARSEPAPQTQDPNRPMLHRGPGHATPAPSAPPPASKSTDKPEPLVTFSDADLPVPPPTATAAKNVAAPAAAPPAPRSTDKPEPLVAVSDAELPEMRPYVFPWNRDEEERLTGEMKTLAEAEVAHQAGGGIPSLDQVRVRAFDLNSDNLGEIVLSARASVATASTIAKAASKGKKPLTTTYYVTVVARTTVSGELRKLFAAVTSSAWLASVPRMEVVDAVDADGDGPAELLFSLVNDSGRSHAYAIYRVGRDELFKLVETGPFPND